MKITGVPISKWRLLVFTLVCGLLFSACAEAQELSSCKEKCGYIDKTGKLAIPQQFDLCWPFSEGLGVVAVVRDEMLKWGYVDKSGKLVIDTQFDAATSFQDGLAAVVMNNKWNFINKTGKIAIDAKFDDAFGFAEGLALVKVGGSYGYIDKSGKFVIKPKYKIAYPFAEGLAAIQTDKGVGFINRSGDIVIKPQFGLNTETGFSEGLVPVSVNGKYGFIDKLGEFVIKPQFDVAYGFHCGLAAVKPRLNKDTWRYIDKTGKTVIAPKAGVEYGSSFSEGLAMFKAANNLYGYMFGFIDKSGQVVIEPRFRLAGQFSEGLALVATETDGWGFVNKKGDLVIKSLPYSEVGDFSEGLAQAISNKANDNFTTDPSH